MQDKELIRLFWSRSDAAITETSAVYGPSLHRFARRITGTDADAQECVNDTYLALWNAIPPARPASFRAYVFRICRNVAFGILDKYNAEKRSTLTVELSEELQQCIPDRLSRLSAERLELSDLLNRFLGTLKREERRIFLRRYWYGDSIAEIGDLTGLTKSNVKTQLFRTREKLRHYLEQEGIIV